MTKARAEEIMPRVNKTRCSCGGALAPASHWKAMLGHVEIGLACAECSLKWDLKIELGAHGDEVGLAYELNVAYGYRPALNFGRPTPIRRPQRPIQDRHAVVADERRRVP